MGTTCQRRLNVRRGLGAAALAALGAAVLVVALPLGFWFIGWDVYDLGDDLGRLLLPVVGFAVLCACAGWATAAPAGQHSFARSLVTVVLLTAFVWRLADVFGVAPVRYKSLTDSEWYQQSVPFIVVPPVVVAAGLTVLRVRRVRHCERDKLADPQPPARFTL
jgi:hypothetical protein